IESALAPLLEHFDLKPGKLYQPVRVAITGTSISPGIFESLAALAPLLDRFDLKPGKLYQPIRVAITGTSISPGIFESLAALGKERSLERIRAAARRLAPA
ncbi:MAG TPA: hypothetical protein VD741_02665, partial [Solirubrobacterales bacterium]|nr:hypothetical protein [Solirubrobacterales bacterium]